MTRPAKRTQTCRKCKGSGSYAGLRISGICFRCNGTGGHLTNASHKEQVSWDEAHQLTVMTAADLAVGMVLMLRREDDRKEAVTVETIEEVFVDGGTWKGRERTTRHRIHLLVNGEKVTTRRTHFRDDGSCDHMAGYRFYIWHVTLAD